MIPGESPFLAHRVPVRAMLDLSDGLARDAWQLSRASRVVWQVDAARIPVACTTGGGYADDVDALARRHAILHHAAIAALETFEG